MKQGSKVVQGSGKWLGIAALGALAMYMLDPDRGRQRRALAQDKMRSLRAKTSDAIDVGVRDLGNRVDGMRARIGRLMTRSGELPDDDVLAARVRSRLGRVVSNPHAIEVAARAGRVSLGGPILAHEKAPLLAIVRGVAGVSEIDDQLKMHEQADGVAGLQGGAMALAARSEQTRDDWTPALRSVAITGGAALGSYGLLRRSPSGFLLAAAGLALLARGASNRPLRNLLESSVQPQTVRLHQSIDINASPEAVFDVCEKYENYPRFLSGLAEVRDLGQQRSHWVAKGQEGTRLEWDAVLTECARPTTLAWQSEPNAAVEHAGAMHFKPIEHGTRVSVRMHYCLSPSGFNQDLAASSGGDPRQQLADDLMRMKNFIESTIPAHDADKSASAPGLVLH